jgi:UDP-N-acetyl-2-amino-2-deoxyglucuronate dehydrogenase
MVNYGIIGYGNAGVVHHRILSRIRNVSVVGIYDTEEARRKAAKDMGIKAYADLPSLIEKVDAVSICTPHNTHAPLAITALRSGVDVICEKPIATNRLDAYKMIQASEENRKLLGVISQHRYEVANMLLKSEIDKGKLGRLISTSISVKWRKEASYYSDWHGNMERCGGGVLITNAIHMIDVAAWLNGGIKAVYAMSKNVRAMEVEDNVMALVEYPNDSFGVFDCSTSTNPFFGSALEVVGSDNSVRLFDGMIVFWGGKSQEEIRRLNEQIRKLNKRTWGKKYFGYGHVFQIEDFINCIKNRSTLAVDGIEGTKALEAVLAIMESAKTGSRIKL